METDLGPDTRAALRAAGLIFPRAVSLLQPLLRCWIGRCQTCSQPVEIDRLRSGSVIPNKALLVLDLLGLTFHQEALSPEHRKRRRSYCGFAYAPKPFQSSWMHGSSPVISAS